MKKLIFVFLCLFLLGCSNPYQEKTIEEIRDENISILEDYNYTDDYYEEEQEIIKGLINDAINLIKTKNTETDIKKVLNDVLSEISFVKTKEEYNEEIENPVDLSGIKSETINLLENLVNLNNYDSENQEKITSEIEKAKESINKSSSKEEILQILFDSSLIIKGVPVKETVSLKDLYKEKREQVENYLDKSLYTQKGIEEIENIISSTIELIYKQTTVESLNDIVMDALIELDNVLTDSELDALDSGTTSVVSLESLNEVTLEDDIVIGNAKFFNGGSIKKADTPKELNGVSYDTYYEVTEETSKTSNGIAFLTTGPAKVEVLFEILIEESVYLQILDTEGNMISFGTYTRSETETVLIETLCVPKEGTYILGATSGCNIYAFEVLEKEVFTVLESPKITLNNNPVVKLSSTPTYDTLFWDDHYKDYYYNVLCTKNGVSEVVVVRNNIFEVPITYYTYSGELRVAVATVGTGGTVLNSSVTVVSVFIKGKLPQPSISFTSNFYLGDPLKDVVQKINIIKNINVSNYQLLVNGTTYAVQGTTFEIPKGLTGPISIKAIAIGDGVNTYNSDYSNEIILYTITYKDNDDIIKTEYCLKNDKLILFTIPKENFLFLGWSTTGVYENLYEIEKVNSNITLYTVYKAPDIDSLVLNLNSDNISYSVIGYIGTEPDLIIPSTFEGLPITMIKKNSFLQKNTLEKVFIPDSVTLIEERAFYGCTSLKKVTMSNNVLEIGKYSFYGCTALEEVVLSNNLKQVADYLFYNCANLVTVNIPTSLQTIGEYGFYKIGVKNIVLPNGVKEIKKYAFSNSLVETITLPNSLTTLADYAFYNSKLTALSLPEGLNAINSNIISNCSNLTSFHISSSIKTVTLPFAQSTTSLATITVNSSSTTFTTINNILYSKDLKTLVFASDIHTSVVVNSGVQTISYYAFYGNKKLEEVTLPNSVTKICQYAFSSTGLKSITIPSSVKEIEKYGFYNNSNLVTVTLNSGLEYLGNYAFSGSKATSYDLPNTLKEMGDYCFSYNSEITEFVIPASVTKIGSYSFSSSVKLKKVTFLGDVEMGSCLFSNSTLLEEVILSSAQKVISSAFAYSYIDSIIIPSSVTKIDYEAFKYSKITEINFSEEGSLEIIGERAFIGCINIKKLDIPNTVKTIDEGAFAYCFKLEEVNLSNKLNVIKAYTFAYTYNLKSITVPKSVTLIDSHAFAFYNQSYNYTYFEDKQHEEKLYFVQCFHGPYPNPLDYNFIPPHDDPFINQQISLGLIQIHISHDYMDFELVNIIHTLTEFWGGLENIYVYAGTLYYDNSFIGRTVTLNTYTD